MTNIASLPPARHLLLAVLILGASMPVAQAIVVRDSEDLDARIVRPTPFRQETQIVAEGETGPAATVAAGFRSRNAGAWRFSFDQLTGRPALISGSGVPLLPGRGNSLSATALGLPPTGWDLAATEPLAGAFIDAEADLLRPVTGELRLNTERSGRFLDGRIWYFDYDWYIDGVPVEGAHVFLRVNHGNVVQFGSRAIGTGRIPVMAILDAPGALGKAFDHAGGRDSGDRIVEPGRLLVLPLASDSGPAPWGGGAVYRLVWRVAFKRGATNPTWTADVDARTGQIVAFYDDNKYARVTGGIYARTVTDPEQERPFTQTNVTHDGVMINTGDDGTYTYTGGHAFAALDGPLVDTFCFLCESPENAFAFTDRGTGDLRLGTGGVDHIGNGVSTPAARNTFFHANLVRRVAEKWLSLAWFGSTLRAFINIDDSCNAFWDGDINFFRSGSGCNNTGEIADVIYHEWGHGLDQFTNLGDGSTGEATGDVTSMHLTHDARIGPGFVVTGDPVRDVDSSRVGYVAHPASLDTDPVWNCVDCSLQGLNCSDGPFGHEVHCEGEIYGQAHWDLAGLMTAKHGFNTGWQDLERIYFVSLPQADTLVPNQSGSVYDAYLAVDDDNGNLADGTPNCGEIFSAFSAHGIDSGSCGASTTGCTRPDQPSVMAAPGSDKVTLTWAASTGATGYRILRADFAPTGAYLPLGSTAGTSFEDPTVHPGITYYYVVEAENASGCRSTIEAAIPGAAAAAARLDVDGVTIDDIPAGNRSGFADPVEAVDLGIPLSNGLPADAASSAAGTLSTSTAGATVIDASATYGAIAAGALAAGDSYQVDLDSPVVCGQEVQFDLSLDDGNGGPATAAEFPVLVGERVVRFGDDFETAQGWTVVPGSPPATAGTWVRGDPVRSSWQPETGAPSGTGDQCFFTGAASLTGGETVLLSPIIDLSGMSAARLSFKRWWASSDITDSGDLFAVDVSDDGGSSWVNVDLAGAAERALAWQPFEVRLESIIPLTSQFRMRARAANLGLFNTVEAALDDVVVEEIVCDLTPPCFVEPAFAGLGTALPGTSCGEVDLLWNAASSNCLNATIAYKVYRSTLPGFTPGPASLVASNLAGTSFHDTLLAPGATYHYVVRAFDSRSGEDTNLSASSVVATSLPDTVAPVFAGAAGAGAGVNCGETIVSWSQASESCSLPVRYDVHRSVTPGFTPGPGNLVASTLSVGYIDTALVPGTAYYYKVRAVDTEDNADVNLAEVPVLAGNLPLNVYQESFEASNGAWGTTAPHNALTGLWEWGDPEGTGAQPEDDATPDPGVNAWITGLATGGGLGGNDIDGGTTTLISPDIDLTGNPGATLDGAILEMALSFINDAGANPNDDPLVIELSDNGGGSFSTVLNTVSNFPSWTTQQFSLLGLTANNQFRIKVTASDLGIGGSLVEAGVDEVRIFVPGAGCTVCPPSPPPVGIIQVDRVGDDIVLDWSADPVAATSYSVYLLSGPGPVDSVRAGTTPTKSFIHLGAALLTGENFTYRVTAVDFCGQESIQQ